MIDLSDPIDRDKLAEKILDDIEAYCEKTYEQGHRNHLGASLMGERCSRMLWYNFRWVKEIKFDGRMLRLFNVGHQAEPRFIQYLRGIGFTVWETDPTTGKQFRMVGCNGHYGGSTDGMCQAPASYELSELLIFLNEFKTNNTGAGYNSVDDKGLAAAKPKHYAQMSQYGKYFKLKYGIYIIENKNDSDLTVQIVPLDWNYASQLEAKADSIINSQQPPARISDNPSYSDCKFCDYFEPCHNNQPVEINCRSCKQAIPVENGEWKCTRYNSIIPLEFIKKGCEFHSSVNE